mmetsp:Transcript_42901/g.80026  ORF Transcript_42901/g.80026 Transcript_42901/m.80026 type:complete len:241 (-) Transcript_42901:19-741(-)
MWPPRRRRRDANMVASFLSAEIRSPLAPLPSSPTEVLALCSSAMFVPPVHASGLPYSLCGLMLPVEEEREITGPSMMGDVEVAPGEGHMPPNGPYPVWDRGSGHHDHERHDHHEPEPHTDDGSEDILSDVGLAMVSSGVTVMLAMMGALCALRICREMLRRRRDGQQGNATETPPLESPVQAFRPFGGQGYRLVVEGDSKPPMSHVSHEANEKTKRDRQSPNEAGLPQLGASVTSPDASA